MELEGLDLSLLLEGFDDVLASPATKLGDVTQHAELGVLFHSEHLEGFGHNHALLVVVRVWDAIEDLQVIKSSLTTSRFVLKHAADGSPEHTGGLFEVLEASAGVGVDALAEEFAELELVSEERSRSVDELATHDDNALTVKQLLSNLGCKSAEQMSSSVNNYLLFEHA